jgi:RHS repeat-associated protein
MRLRRVAVAGCLGTMALLVLLVPGLASAGGQGCAADSPYSRLIARSSSLVGYWRLADLSHRSVCATHVGLPGHSHGQVRAGQAGGLIGDVGASVAFDGRGEVAVEPAREHRPGHGFTFEVWFRRSRIGRAGAGVIAATPGAWSVRFDARNRLVIRVDSTVVAQSAVTVGSGSAWHYLAVTERDLRVRVLLDGQQVARPRTRALLSTRGPVDIGAERGADGFHGWLEQAALYDSALSRHVVRTHFAAGEDPNTVRPSIIGRVSAAGRLTAHPGNWGAPSGFRYRWQECATAKAQCVDIPGATHQTLQLGQPAVGRHLRVLVTARHGAVASTAASRATARVRGEIPAPRTAPSVTGRAAEGQPLTAGAGQWAGTPRLRFRVRWERCQPDETACVRIPDASSWAYTPTRADLGTRLRILVWAVNAQGRRSATSRLTRPVRASASAGHVVPMTSGAPVNTTAPAISGNLVDGQTLTTSSGTWSGTTPISYAYQWQRCTARGASCTAISGATTTTYHLAPADVGHVLQIKVTATNSAGSASATAQTATTIAAAPAPTITSVSHSNLPSQPVYNGSDNVTATATSTGPGVKQLEITDQNGDVIASYNSTCAGTGASPCPSSLTKTLTVSYTDIPLGTDTLSLVAIDAAGLRSTASTWTVTDVIPPSCSDTWNGNAADGSWDTAGNWSTGAIPTGHDYACLPAGSKATIGNSDDVGRLADQGTLTITGSLSVDDPSNPSTTNDLSVTGDLLGSGEVDVAGSASLVGQLEGPGAVVVESTASATVDGASIEGILRNEGSLTVTSDGVDVGSASSSGPPAELVNATGATMVVAESFGDGTLLNGLYDGELVNDGTLSPSGSGTAQLEIPIDNEGTINTSAGTMTFEDGTVAGTGEAGAWNVASAGTLSFNEGDYGTVPFEVGTINVNGSLQLAGDGTVVNANAVNASTGSVSVSGGALSVDSTSVIDQLTVGSETSISGSGAVDVVGSASLQGQLDGSLVVESGASATVDSADIQGSVRNEGSLTVTSDGVDVGSASGSGPPAELVNATGATMVVAESSGDGTLLNGLYDGELVNDGTLQPSDSGTAQLEIPIDNEGTINDSTGTLEFEDGTVAGTAAAGGWNVATAGTLTFDEGDDVALPFDVGAINVDGSLQIVGGGADVNVDAVNASAGAVSVSAGTLSVDSTSVIDQLSVGADGVVSGSGEIEVAGTATLQGQLDGAIAVPSGASATVDGAALEGTLRNEGSLTVTSHGADVEAQSFSDPPAELVNAAGATMVVAESSGNGTVINGLYDGELVNDGTLQPSGSGTAQLEIPIDNEGTINANAGTLEFEDGTVAGTAAAGAWNVATAGTLTFDETAPEFGNAPPFDVGAINVDGSLGLVGGGADVNADAVNASTGSVTVSGGDLRVSSTSVIDSLSVGSNGSVSGSGEIDVSGSGTLSGAVDGFLVVESGASATVNGAWVAGTLRNEGSLTVGNAGGVQVDGSGLSPAMLINATGATMTVATGSNGGMTGGAGSGELVNDGMLQSSGTGSAQIAVPIDNEGTVQAPTGTLSFAAGSVPWTQDVLTLPSLESSELDDTSLCPSPPVAQTGAWTASSGAAIQFSDGCYTFGAASTLSGTVDVQPTGIVQLGPTQSPNAVITDTGSLVVEAEPMQTQPPQIGTLNLGGSADLNGSVSGTGELDVCTQFTATGGGLAGPGAVVLCSGSTSTIDPPASGVFGIAASLVNRGTLTWSGGPIVATSSAVLWNAGTFVANGQTGTYSSSGSILYNTGAIEKTSGSGTTEIDALLFDQGSETESSGHLKFAGDNLVAQDNPNGPIACQEAGGTVATGWVNLLQNPVQVIAGTIGAQCTGTASATATGTLTVGSYPGGGTQTSLASAICGGVFCAATAGTVLSPGQTGYFDAEIGATYTMKGNFSFSFPGQTPATGSALYSVDDPVAPGTTTGGPLPPSASYGGGNPASPNSVTAMCGDPVVCATGDQTEQQTDLSVGGTGGGMGLVRTYNSQLAASQDAPGAFGYGWTGPFDEHLTLDDAARTGTVQNANGSTVAFTGDDVFSAPAGAEASLTRDDNGDFDYVADQTTVVFDPSGNILSSTDRIGQTTSFSYNGAGQVTQMTAPSGRSIGFTYNAQGLVASATDPSGLTISYAYDTSENLTAVSDSADSGDRWQLGYDSSHELTSMTDADGNQTQIFYTHGKVSEQIDPSGNHTTWSYEPGETDITLPNGSETRELFNPDGDLLASTRAVGTSAQSTESFTFTPQDEVATSTNGDGQTTTYEYDDAGNLTSETDPDGNTTSWTYDAARDRTSEQTPSGETTTYSYNSSGELTGISRLAPNGETQTSGYTYYGNGNLETSTDPRDETTSYDYNSQGDLTSETDAGGDVQTWADYTADGWPQTMVSPRGNVINANPSNYTTSYQYDALGDLTKITDPNGNTIKYGYDAAGNQTSTTDGDDNQTTVTYNAANQPHIVTLPDESTEVSTYNSLGLLASQTNEAGQQTTYGYDPAGNLQTVTTPSGLDTTYQYDAAGNQTGMTNADNRTTSYSYNGEGQVSSINYPGATPTASFSYTADGQLGSVSDGTGTSSYTYDQLDRLTSQTNGDGQTISYGYDLANDQTSITYPDGNQLTQAFNADEQLSSVTDWLGHTTSFGYDPDGNLQTTQFPAATGEVDTNTYDPADQLTDQDFSEDGSSLATLSYGLDANGEIGQETQTGLPGSASVSYGYNSDDELSSAGSNNYVYNADGDPTTSDGTSGYSYQASTDELQSGPTTSYGYDDLGQRTSTTLDGQGAQGTTDYSYDQAGRLTKVAPGEGEGPGSSYSYDGNGLLASETIGNQTTQFAWDTSNGLPLPLSDGTNDYLYGPTGVPFEQINTNGNPTYLHQDQLGSTRLLTDQDGMVTGSDTYTPYGSLSGSTGTATTPFGYAGQYTDPATGFEYDQARWYDPSTAQFLTPDPLDALTQQPYDYAADDPTSLTDPTGLLFGITRQSLIDFSAGFGDTISFGATRWFRQNVLGVNDVNYCSTAFAAAGDAGDALRVAEAMVAPESEALEATEDGPTIAEGSADHIFRDAPGHLADDTPENRALIEGVVQPENYVSTGGGGEDLYRETLPNGTQVWAKVYNGSITNGGVNQTPLP